MKTGKKFYQTYILEPIFLISSFLFFFAFFFAIVDKIGVLKSITSIDSSPIEEMFIISFVFMIFFLSLIGMMSLRIYLGWIFKKYEELF